MSENKTDKDVEMKEEVEKKEEEKNVPEPIDPFFGNHWCFDFAIEFKKVMVLMEKAAKDKDFKLAASLTK